MIHAIAPAECIKCGMRCSTGARCARYFAVSPVCSPSRGSAMTGRYPQSNGLMGLVHNPWLWELNPDERHLAQIGFFETHTPHGFGGVEPDDESYAAERVRLTDALFAWMESVRDPLLKRPPWTPFYQKAVDLYRSRRGADEERAGP